MLEKNSPGNRLSVGHPSKWVTIRWLDPIDDVFVEDRGFRLMVSRAGSFGVVSSRVASRYPQ